ncbi:hypothetical protein VPH219E481_0024 [Vibrio phage 219E48-1]|nr:hypothetical protein PODOV021v1_p0011 [Vibrio phage 219E41.2]QZI91031.1 hypothetical protein PODOV032v1_p0026 [Vibrio phage 219E41.1]QZI91152.1 hypothetical protein PODOV060v1_p0058 [Vibrio phage 234P8]QZI91555.1 hypothetical protein PODOV087v1_p0050 [Vibrio phage 431E45.1]QZI91661.1 hypothetical protein PODOV086v1_p0077 [Vibrio phage 431E46.1]QZI91694.1 hypothetical protein PODOV088v1_p0033 [Vibrio phage 431E48.2]
MNINAVTLKSWIDQQYKSYDTPPVQQKEEVAFELNVGVATIYRWLKAGNVYIQELGPDASGENGPVFIWKMEKVVDS